MTLLLSSTVESFLVRHGFLQLGKRRHVDEEDRDSDSPRKKAKVAFDAGVRRRLLDDTSVPQVPIYLTEVS